MGLFSARSRSSLLGLVILLTATFGTSVHAQELFGMNLPLPSFGRFSEQTFDFASIKSVCGPLTFYAGWVDLCATGNDTGFGIEGIFNGSQRQLDQIYADRGIRLGVSDSVPLTRGLALTISGWYLFAKGARSDRFITSGPLAFIGESDIHTDWWHADGLFAVGPKCGASVLAGVRYDSYTSSFDGREFIGAAVASGTRSDLISQVWIPLLGLQYNSCGAVTDLNVRFCGFSRSVRIGAA